MLLKLWYHCNKLSAVPMVGACWGLARCMCGCSTIQVWMYACWYIQSDWLASEQQLRMLQSQELTEE